MCILLDLAPSSFLQIHKNPPFNYVIVQFWRLPNFIDSMCNLTDFKSSILHLACQRSLILYAYISHIIFHWWNDSSMDLSYGSFYGSGNVSIRSAQSSDVGARLYESVCFRQHLLG